MRQILIILVLALISGIGISTIDVKAQTSKVDPKMVQLLKDQAGARKQFYDNESRTKAELKAKQSARIEELLQKHRAARAEFAKEKHTADERGEFFRGQRKEMAELKAEQRKERREFLGELKKKFTQFHAEQKKERAKLASELKATK